MKCWI